MSTVHALTIARRREARWFELEVSAWARCSDAEPDFSEPYHIVETRRMGDRVLALLKQIKREASTKEIAGRLGVHAQRVYSAAATLRQAGKVSRRTDCRSASGHRRIMWSAR